MKKLLYFFVGFVTTFFILNAVTIQAQEIVLSDEFDDGDGLWTSGWIDGATTVTFSIDSTGKLSGDHSYKAVITQGVAGGGEMWHIQRNANLPLVAGYQYTVSFMAVSDSADAALNVLLELAGDPFTKRIDDTASITNTPQTFTYSAIITEDVPTNQLKFMFAGARNTGKTIWLDNIVVTRIADPTLVTQWGSLARHGWPLIPTTEDGSASMGGTGNPPSGNWATLIGGFDTLTASETEAIVAKGQIEFIGGGPTSWSALRWGLFFFDTLGTLQYPGTDTARWSGNQDAWGYLLLPQSGAIAPVGWANGGIGTQGAINGGGWISSNSPGGALGVFNHAPRNADMTAGIYNWAVSVQKLTDSTNELRYYLIKEDNSYWIGGTVVDTVAPTLMFNAVAFGINNGNGIETTGLTRVNLSDVNVEIGDPIDVPKAPWESYYIDLWGLSGEYNTLWPILNDSATIVGDASMSGEVMSGWRALQGGFGQDVEISTEEALIIEGQIEFAGGAPSENAYTPIRYALTYQDSNSTLVNALTDSATWSHTGNHFGYGFHPRTGNGTMSNGNGGVGTVWTINNGNWASTFSNNGGPVAAVNQAPRNADLIEGVYDFAISVHAINDSTNEIRWYMVEENNQYWFGGITQGAATTQKFNSILFGVDQFEGTAFNVIGMQIDKGDPIDVPDAPWEAYFIGSWGFIGDPATRTGGWQLTPGQVVGNVSISGDAPVPADQWSAVRGGFETFITSQTRPFKITGTVEFADGGFESWSSFRMGVFYSDSAGIVDSTEEYGYMWNGTENYHNGYLFMPHSGTNDIPTWSGPGTTGTWGTVVNSTWLSTNGADNYILGSGLQEPAEAVAGADEYDFELSVTPQGDGTNLVKFQLVKDDGTYKWQVEEIDNNDPLATDKFNSISFAVGSGNTTTAMHLTDVQIDTGTAVDVNNPENLIPTQHTLSQNYPNPFNPTTTIEFALPQTGDVNLAVYDILGRKVADLIKGNLNAGYHKINFNASHLSSGVYFYRIESGDFVNVKKLMLLK
jgi:hypothetical protein